MYSPIKVVCFGGGTGLPTLLSGLKHNPWLNITAIVSMFDTGGSSGELRDRFGILPPGDVLKCLLALSKHESYARELLLKRISHFKSPGHNGGNALIYAFVQILGSYPAAIDAVGQLLSIRGKVIPVTLTESTLCARYRDGSICHGETSVDLAIHEGKQVKELFLDGPVRTSEAALEAIAEADVFCIGPGSFYTSVLPNFLTIGLSAALEKSSAKIIFIANLLTEGRGMKGMYLEEIVDFAERQITRGIDYVIANDHWPARNSDILSRYAAENKYPIISGKGGDPRVIVADLWSDKEIARHDCAGLAHLVSVIINAATGKFIPEEVVATN